MINVSQPYLKLIKAILKKHVPNTEVWVFGSRLTKRIKKYSDLDLAIVSNQNISAKKMNALKDKFAESNLPFRVDLLDWNTITKEFKSIIKKKYKIIQKRKK
ncbi:MAG: hypothetical protein A2539_05170 [Elusimicrobia bacterium RIFOXYD2_FULL_34_15]|nr:MAG: hypothetical protein A2539_05170 [Elusimicrobia bacterium RIFOXYD2_FULL_34_15]